MINFDSRAAERVKRARNAELLTSARIEAIDRQAERCAKGAGFVFIGFVILATVALYALAKAHGL